MPTTSWTLSAELVGLQQTVLNGFQMTGEIPDASVLPNAPDKDRDVFVIPSPVDSGDNDTDGGGLFDPFTWFNSNGRHIYAHSARILTGDGATNWEINVTDGLRGGSDTLVDAEARDVTLASGSGDSIVTLDYELLQSELIRVKTTSAVTADFSVVLRVALAYSDGGIRG